MQLGSTALYIQGKVFQFLLRNLLLVLVLVLGRYYYVLTLL